MKKLLLILFLSAASLSQAQVGINTEDPRALLDIKAANEVVATNTPGVMVVGDGLLVPRVSTLLVDTDFPIEGLVVYLTATFEDTSVVPSVTYEPGFYVSYSGSWETFGAVGGSGELAEFNEGGTIGYRLADSNPANHGNVGLFATDLSLQQTASTSRGATGDGSFVANIDNTASGSASSAFGLENTISGLASSGFGQLNTVSGNLSFAAGSENNITNDGAVALGASSEVSGTAAVALGADNEARGAASLAAGEGTIANADGEVAVGQFNTDYSAAGNAFDRVFTVGNGTSDASRTDALIIQKNGIITAPTMSTADIDASPDRVLITKEWYNMVQANVFQGILEVTEGGNTGLRRADLNSDNVGNIGNFALDLSVSLIPSATRGATGTNSVAFGGGTTASGISSASLGRRTVASGLYSLSGGFQSRASGEASTALGEGATAIGLGEVALGRYNTNYTVTGTNTDRVFTIGNGTDDLNRSDAFIVQRNGLVTAPNLTTTQIANGSNKALTTKEYNDQNYIGRLPSGDTASRPTGASAPAFGTMRYNTETGRPEVYVENSTNLPTGSTYVPGWISL